MTKEPKILKTRITTNDGIYVVDTIEIEGLPWLVPRWIDNHPTKGFSTPEYMIRIMAVKSKLNTVEYDYLLNDLLPKSVFLGKPTKEFEGRYEIRHLPDLFFEIQSVRVFH